MKQTDELSAKPCKKQKGSVIVGVLAATMFIGIATSLMVKNTGSQSQISRGHQTTLTSSSTVRSGIIATETSLRSDTALVQRMRRIAEAAIDGTPNTENRFVFGTVAQRQALTAGQTNQAFSSRLVDVVEVNNALFGRFDVRSGRTAGRDIDSAAVFGGLGNLEIQPNQGSDNALFLRDGNGLANMTININGDVTIGQNFLSNNGGIINGSLFVNGSFGANNKLNIRDNYCAKDGVTASWMINQNLEGKQPLAWPCVDLDCVQEPEININLIPAGVRRLNLNEVANLVGNHNLNDGITNHTQFVVNIAAHFNTFRTVVASVPPAQRYRGTHAVIVVRDGELFRWNFNVELNDNIIIVLEGNAQLRGDGQGFYRSPAAGNSSTLIYAGGQSRIIDFAIHGLFRGYIHIDKDNASPHIIIAATGTNIIGAIHNLGSGRLTINAAGSGPALGVTHDINIINTFSTLMVDNPAAANCGGNGGLDFTNGQPQINFTPFGYYFY